MERNVAGIEGVEDIKTITSCTDYDVSKTPGKCGIFYVSGVA